MGLGVPIRGAALGAGKAVPGLDAHKLGHSGLAPDQGVGEFLNVADLFTSIHDIQSNGFKGKPYPEAYHKALASSGFSISQTIFFDDHKKYTDGYQALGGQAVLVQHPSEANRPHPLDSHSAPDVLPQLVIPSVYQIPQVLEQLAAQS